MAIVDERDGCGLKRMERVQGANDEVESEGSEARSGERRGGGLW